MILVMLHQNLISVSQKTDGLDLIQNCDLPLPVKVLTLSDKNLCRIGHCCSVERL